MKGAQIESFFEKNVRLRDYEISEINKEIFEYYSCFVEDKESLIVCLLQKVFVEFVPDQKIKSDFGESVYEKLLILNKFLKMDFAVIDKYLKNKDLIVLFLLNYKTILQNKNYLEKYELFLSHECIEYAMKVLSYCYIGEIREDLEDKFFYILDSKAFNEYCSAIFFGSKTHLKCENTIKYELTELFKQKGINVNINCRLKSVYGVYKKVKKKNILLSQVLDIVGIRIITENDEDCYVVMKEILNKWQSINTKVKDYVALPKDNGYRSIHLTILIDDHPVEIQIRSNSMHDFAQYGVASHIEYKN